MVEESTEQDINEWYRPMDKWSPFESARFVKWFAEAGASFESMAQVLEGYRAVRDVEASVQETVIYNTKDRYAFGWTDTKGIFGSGK
jgi:hypothetical protein